VWTIRGVVLAGALAIVGTAAWAEEPIGVIKRAKGDVRIERAGEHIPVAKGTLIQRGDRLITGPAASASVTMRRTAPITLGPGNDVTLDRYAADEQPTVNRAAPPILQGLASYFAVNRQR
jgi:hypothetical protein